MVRNYFFSIAIDGPSGAGKSTIAKEVATSLGFVHVDTGGMYRGIALYYIENDININEDMNIDNIDNIDISVKFQNNIQKIYLKDLDVTDKLRTQEVAKVASKIAKSSLIRDKLVNMQREVSLNNNVVMDGRDICSNVLPNANLKIYLDASVEVRTNRRINELTKKGGFFEYNTIKKEIELRDYEDKTRKENPLLKTEDSIYIDTTNFSKTEVISKILDNYNRLI